MAAHDAVLAEIRAFRFAPATTRPRLLFGAADVADIRTRAAALPEKRAALLAAARAHLKTPGATIDTLQTYASSGVAADVAQAYLLESTPEMAAWLKARTLALLNTPTWFAPVHIGGCKHCDHCMCNTAAHLALVADLAPDAFAAADVAQIAAGVKRLFLDPFLAGTENPCEWWYRPNMPSNWKIMCCGEGGLAICGFAEYWPEAPEALARAAQGVLELLDLVPREGDWGEGVGYWFHTLWMGLRFARALRRLSGGKIDLFQHPALQNTGDFLTQLTTPSGRVYNFSDCDPGLSPVMVESLAMLAAEAKRPDWMYVARLAPAATPLYLATAAPALPATPSPRRAAGFTATGVAALRTGWRPEDLVLGFKCGPSTSGHSHLDANSLFLEAGGQPLLIEYPYWPQAHFLGFHDSSPNRRWNFDGPGTVGHSTILVDGQGQSYGAAHPGRLLGVTEGAGWAMASGDASACYPGRLRKFVRTVLLAGTDTIIIRDVVECDGERHVEWLLHYGGNISSTGITSVVENNGVRLTVLPLLPERTNGWRWNDVTRTSVYECSDTRQEVTRSVRYRSFMPFRQATSFEFLFALRVNGAGDGRDVVFSGAPGAWSLAIPHANLTVTPAGDTLKTETTGSGSR